MSELSDLYYVAGMCAVCVVCVSIIGIILKVFLKCLREENDDWEKRYKK